MEEAYSSFIRDGLNAFHYIISVLSVYAPFIRKIPTARNKRYNNTRKTIERESKKMMEEKYNDDKNNKLDGVDLLSRLISINKSLPIEEKLTDDELKNQVVKKEIFYLKEYIAIIIIYLFYILDHDNFYSRT